MALSAPQGNGDMLNPVDVESHALIVTPIEFVPHIATQFTKAGEVSPAIRVNVIDLNAEGGPTVYKGVLWFNVKLYNGLRKQIGQEVLGRMIKGVASPGQSAPWQLEDLMSDQSWVNYANQVLGTPLGVEFTADSVYDVLAAANAPQVVAPATAAPAAAATTPPPAQPVAASAPPAAVAPSFAPPNAPAVAPAGAPPAAGSPTSAAAGLPAAMQALLAGLPEAERVKAEALLAAQAQASS